jgi:hypothetical protein
VTLVAAAAALGSGSGSAAIDPTASAFLAGAVKAGMQKTMKTKVPGLVITKVTCFVPRSSAAVAGKCTTKFTVAKYKLDGVYHVRAKLDSRGRLTWATTSVACSDSRTHKRVSC